jgi:hypothetical protein
LEDERLKANDHIIAPRAEAKGELMAKKAAQQDVMKMKQEAQNVEFGQGVVIPLAPHVHAVAGASSTSSIVSTPSSQPRLQSKPPNTYTPSQGIPCYPMLRS